MRRNFHTPEDRVWFTADLHFGHHAMIHKAHRPWDTVDVMDEALIKNWNNCVEEKDHVFVLGDFSFRSNAETVAILGRLKGRKYLIEGNHDRRRNAAVGAMWDGIAPYHEIVIDGQPIVLCHFAFRSWNRMHYGAWNLHGHSHGNLPPMGKQLDVGVDACAGTSRVPAQYAPISFVDVKFVMDGRDIEIVDHHVPKSVSLSALVKRLESADEGSTLY